MNIDIKSKNIELTAPLNDYIIKKIGALERFIKRWDFDGGVEARIEVGRSTKHHHKGEVFFAEINLRLPKKVFTAREDNFDVRVAVDGAHDELEAQIKKYKERQQTPDSKKLTREARKLRGKE